MKRINSLPEDSLEEIVDFIELKEDPLSKTIGICEGPSGGEAQ